MSLNHYLEKLASNLVLSFDEDERIKSALKTLNHLIEDHLLNVHEHFCFGSYKRGTRLTHRVDPSSDVDYLIVFNKKKDEDPEELVLRLKEFVEGQFQPSAIHRLSPTCIVEIDTINIELIPAYKEGDLLINYKIPSTESDEIEWIPSVPNEYNNYLKQYNSEHNFYLVPLIRVLKYWNIINDNVFSSYDLEHELMFKDFPKFDSFTEYFFYAVENISAEKAQPEKAHIWEKFQTQILSIKDELSEEKALHQLSALLPYI